MPEVAQAALTPRSRELSNAVFGRPHQLEVATAVGAMDAGFVVEDLVLKARERATDAGLDPPKESAVRKNLTKLVSAGAVSVLPSTRPGIAGYYSVDETAPFWPFLLDLYGRT